MKSKEKFIRRFYFVLLLFFFASFSVQSQNLLKNPGFEDSNVSFPEWNQLYFQASPVISLDSQDPHQGLNCVSIENTTPNDSRLIQTVRVTEKSNYKLSAWIRADAVSANSGGANLSLADFFYASSPVYDTAGKWKYVEYYVAIETQVSELAIGVRLGNFANLCAGKAYFDDVSMVKVDKIPVGATSYQVGVPAAVENDPIDMSSIITWILVILSIAVFAFNFFMKKVGSK
jgi:dolichyl-phosphate-mannose-protein mannosyltransferase